VNIRLISSLVDDDEDRFAPVLLNAIADLLSETPITYSLLIETTRGRTFRRSRAAPELPASTMPRRARTRLGSWSLAHPAEK
jgi:hypothetical protein